MMKLIWFSALLALAGCRGDERSMVPEAPMPANTVLLAQMMREISGQPGFTEKMLAELDKGGKVGAAFLTPALVDELRKMILGKDWQGLDRFPGWTMRAINPTVRVIGDVAGKGASGDATEQVKAFLDLGPYAMDKAEVVNLDSPSTLPGFTTDGIVSDLGDGVLRGDGANAELAAMHAESQRLADVLNRLSVNDLNGAKPFKVELTGVGERMSIGQESRWPEELISQLVSAGHRVEVSDVRYFANFGHFHFKGQEVMMPFWVNSQILIPGTKRPLLVPVAHAEYEWRVRGPKINGDVSWYFGVDGKAEFRVMDTLDQAWVLKRHAHEYRGADAVEVTRLAGKMVVAYMHQHIARPELPFGGYYALGVCQDSISAIEKKMTGKVTLFPNTVDISLFDDERDAEVNALIQAIPNDRGGGPPKPERIFGSLPTGDLAAITIPGLSADLTAVQAAWRSGHLERARRRWHWIVVGLVVLGVVLALLLVGSLMWRRTR